MRRMLLATSLCFVSTLAIADEPRPSSTIELECTARYNSGEMVCAPKAHATPEAARQPTAGSATPERAAPEVKEPAEPRALPPAQPVAPAPQVTPRTQRQPTSGKEIKGPATSPKSGEAAEPIPPDCKSTAPKSDDFNQSLQSDFPPDLD